MADTREALARALASTGITTAAELFDPASVEEGARVVYRHEGTRSLKAGGSVIAVRDLWSVTLYSARRAPAAEDAVTGALRAAGIPAGDSSSGYDDEHRLHWVEWDFELVRKPQTES